LLGAAGQCKHDRFILFIVKGEKQIKSEKKWRDPQRRSRGKYGLPAVVKSIKKCIKKSKIIDFLKNIKNPLWVFFI
jgi:hypothetical protein